MTMKNKTKGAKNQIASQKPPLKPGAGLKAMIDMVLDRKFGKDINNKLKDDCDSCGEKCFD